LLLLLLLPLLPLLQGDGGSGGGGGSGHGGCHDRRRGGDAPDEMILIVRGANHVIVVQTHLVPWSNQLSSRHTRSHRTSRCKVEIKLP